MRSPPLSLYVHLPWCVSKCPYCDFNSHALKNTLPAARYLDALVADLESDISLAGGRPVISVYFGGGTPSLFSAGHIGSLLASIRARVNLAPDAEITLEANPGTLERDSFSAYREAGVNRVSLGVQTFDENLLRSIGRIHGRAEIDQALESLHDAGLGNFNIDLMYGLPGQTRRQAADDVERALAARPTHLSHYQLTIEPNTAFAVRPPRLPDEERLWDMQEDAEARLGSAGLEQYEISAWAWEGWRCRHNLNYWRFGDYLGIGAGAHAKLTDVARGMVRRLAKTRHPRRYMEGRYLAASREIQPTERVFEYFLNALRLRDELVPQHFSSRTGLGWDSVEIRVQEALEMGLMRRSARGFETTDLGWRFVNELQAMFLPAEAVPPALPAGRAGMAETLAKP